MPNGVTAALDLDEADLLVASLAELPFEQLLHRLGGAPADPAPPIEAA